MATANVDGTNLYYREAGSGEPFLLIHGTGFTADVWNNVFDVLAHNYRTIIYDRRAYQRSQGNPPSTADYTLQQGEDIAALLQAVGAMPANLLGWSAAGIYALYATLIHPNCAKHLLLYEPPLYLHRYMNFPLFQRIITLSMLKATGRKQAAIEYFARTVLAYQDGRNSYEHLSPELRAQLDVNADTLFAETAAELRDAVTSALKPELLRTQVKVPATLLVGQQSPSSFKKAAENVARILHNAPILWLPESNHLAQIDQPEHFLEGVHAAFTSR